MQRIGVFVCHCGSNIAATVDVKKVVELAAKEPGVVHAEDYQYMCSEAGQAKIQEAIKEKNLTGVVVCSCSPRMHEATFRKAAERAGLNPYMVEIANIREHCSWIHKDMEEATKKAVILARAAIAKVNLNTPLQPGESRVTKRALIIGGGIAGCACAYRLARCRVRVVLLEKENDICMGATRANSAIMHAGYDPHPGTLMAKLNVKGNAMSREICKKLHVSWKDTGSLVVPLNDEDMDTLQDLLERGRENGVPGLELWDAAQVRAKEPNVTETAKGALWAPTAAIVNPWEFGLAMAEVAVQNGCELRRRFPVEKIEKTADGYALSDGKDTVEARYVINAAGVYADRVNNLVAAPSFTVEPTVGEYYLLDKCEGNRVSTVIFQCPGKEGKGVLVAPTVHGNLIVGPNAVVRRDPDDTSDTAAGLAEVRQKAVRTVPGVDFRQNIRNFAGMRANSTVDDFIIDFAAAHFLNVAGIRSPGLTSAPAIADYAAELLAADGLDLTEKDSYIDSREKVHFNRLSAAERKALIEKNPAYGRVICRCETVTEGEILDAIHSPIPPVSVDGIKRRTGAGMGRCQGGFCGPRVVDLLARELGVSPLTILQDRDGSEILTAYTKGEVRA